MGRFRGALIGLVTAPVVVVAFGALCGFVDGWAPCHGIPFSAYGLGFGALIYGYWFGLPAAVLGLTVGAALAKGPRGMTVGKLMTIVAASAVSLLLVLVHVRRV